MRQPFEKRSSVNFNLTALITRCEHDPIISHGTAINCIYTNSDAYLYDVIDPETNRSHPFPEGRRVTMREAGPGLVFDHRWHTCPLELKDASLRTRDGKLHLEDVYEHLWYYVMFRSGLFWARWNWVEVMTKPSEIHLVRDLHQGAEAR